MNTMHHHHSYRPSPLEIKQLAEFDATLGDMLDIDKRQRRIIYLRDAMQQVGMQKSALKGFGCFMIPFAIIPIFWPFLIFFLMIKKKANNLVDSQLINALDYWDIHLQEIR
jgi:hypothetical protein